MPISTKKSDIEYRINKLNQINQKIFDLVYYGHFTYSDCESMTTVELDTFYTKLREVKDAENKAQEDALKATNSARKSNNQSGRRRR